MNNKTASFRKFINPYYKVFPEGDYWEKLKPDKDKIALLIIDIQKHYLALAKGIKDNHGNGYLADRMFNLVIPNTEKLLKYFRSNDLVVTYAAIGNQRSDGRDRSPTQARPGWNYTLLKIGSANQEIVDSLKPIENEIVVYKTTDSAVNGTQYGHILRWMGIQQVVVAGVFTDQCVAGTVRDLSDWGYTVFLVEDATAALTPEIQEWETRIINQIYCKVVSPDEILEDLSSKIV
jgi:nicotinamidase-related amidase